MTALHTTPTRPPRSAIVALYAGLALTVGSMIVLYVGQMAADVLGDHIRVGYPGYEASRIDTAVTTYLVYLSVVGVLGIASWLVAIRVTASKRRWARWLVTTMFVLGTGVALFNALVTDTSGDTGLPPLIGWVWLAPSLAGLVAVTMLWRRSRTQV